ncbi:hypothetical protein DXN04_08815 [Chitinophaga silvisoli]|uniref:Uncharacterized protein n=1 Tax=Chitinophaga silvisoli TaxID=2291814 RepID=A0A3E1P5N2_9BACT|nr:hypothetical protein DXN04_08815 [Chitinophaga silvisoli]
MAGDGLLHPATIPTGIGHNRIDNLLFSVDYPFSTNETGKEFLNNTGLSVADQEKLKYKNAERILGL